MEANNPAIENMAAVAHFGKILCIRFEMPKIGESISQHAHLKDHLSILASGSVSVQINNDPPTTYVSPHIIYVPAYREHKITSLSDDTVWYCIFSTDMLDEEEKKLLDGTEMPIFDQIDILAGSAATLSKKIQSVLSANKKLLEENNLLKRNAKLDKE